MLKWLNMEQGLKNCTTIDSHIQSQIQTERQRWRDILERLLAIVKFLASHNLAFRGHRENLTTDSYESSGNFFRFSKINSSIRSNAATSFTTSNKQHYK
jgi:hypothetical protein